MDSFDENMETPSLKYKPSSKRINIDRKQLFLDSKDKQTTSDESVEDSQRDIFPLTPTPKEPKSPGPSYDHGYVSKDSSPNEPEDSILNDMTASQSLLKR